MDTRHEVVVSIAILLVTAVAVVAFAPPVLPSLGVGEDDTPTEAETVQAVRSPIEPTVSEAGTAGTTTDLRRPTRTQVPEVRVVGDLGVNATKLWRWTERALDRDVEAPIVEVRPPSVGPEDQEISGFGRLMLRNSSAGNASRNVATFAERLDNAVSLYRPFIETSDDASIEAILVHEFTHIVTFQTEGYKTNRPESDPTTDEVYAWTALLEGSADFVTETYTGKDRYSHEEWREMSALHRYFQWDYHRGEEYVDSRVDDPAELWDLLHNPPRTTAGMLRNDTSPKTIPDPVVDVETEEYERVESNRAGAILVETSLSTELAPNTSRSIAEGWQTDKLITLQRATDKTSAYAWVTKWRTSNATNAFESAMKTYLDARGVRQNERWSEIENTTFGLDRLDDRTVSVLVGPESFVTNYSILDRNGSYVVNSEVDSAS